VGLVSLEAELRPFGMFGKSLDRLLQHLSAKPHMFLQTSALLLPLRRSSRPTAVWPCPPLVPQYKC